MRYLVSFPLALALLASYTWAQSSSAVPLPPDGSSVRVTVGTQVFTGKLKRDSAVGWIRLAVPTTGELIYIRTNSISAFTTKEAEAPGGEPTRKCVVYVHGIGPHPAHYSDGWWDAMNLHLTSGHGLERVEVLWSDIVNNLDAPGAGAAEARDFSEDVKDILRDRAQQQRDALGELAEPLEEAPGGIPGIGHIDDFALYMTVPDIRAEVIGRFEEVVRPLLADGTEVHVISHSWGTVVAYEGLTKLSADESLPSAQVRSFFTVGSALSIGPVKRRLEFGGDGVKPRLVRRWINLDASFDIVGGRLKDDPFQVDVESLNLVPVGCGRIIASPSCAHSSYFHRDNTPVNRDHFARFILD